MYGQANKTVDLDVVEDTINAVLLDFNLDVLWQNSTARLITKAFIV